MSSESQKPLFSLNLSENVNDNDDIDENEEEEENIEENKETPFSSPVQNYESSNTAKIIEGEEEEDEEDETYTTPTVQNHDDIKVDTPQKRTHSQSSHIRKLISSNMSTRKYATKKILYLYDRIKEEIHKISHSLDGSIKTLQNTWDHYSSTNTKLDTLNQKLSQLKNPLKLKALE